MAAVVAKPFVIAVAVLSVWSIILLTSVSLSVKKYKKGTKAEKTPKGKAGGKGGSDDDDEEITEPPPEFNATVYDKNLFFDDNLVVELRSTVNGALYNTNSSFFCPPVTFAPGFLGFLCPAFTIEEPKSKFLLIKGSTFITSNPYPLEITPALYSRLLDSFMLICVEESLNIVQLDTSHRLIRDFWVAPENATIQRSRVTEIIPPGDPYTQYKDLSVLPPDLITYTITNKFINMFYFERVSNDDNLFIVEPALSPGFTWEPRRNTFRINLSYNNDSFEPAYVNPDSVIKADSLVGYEGLCGAMFETAYTNKYDSAFYPTVVGLSNDFTKEFVT